MQSDCYPKVVHLPTTRPLHNVVKDIKPRRHLSIVFNIAILGIHFSSPEVGLSVPLVRSVFAAYSFGRCIKLHDVDFSL